MNRPISKRRRIDVKQLQHDQVLHVDQADGPVVIVHHRDFIDAILPHQ
jgi:hypothetical protein